MSGFFIVNDTVLRVAALYGVFIGFDHLFYHLTANGACFLGGEVAVITLLEVDADFP